ncbi:uncharacterized protein [Diadema antillarum]|uniref:uncharacterized protein n=1 Tax=Diadema antillarum TaxID=105358 RepID=UPI003A88992A
MYRYVPYYDYDADSGSNSDNRYEGIIQSMQFGWTEDDSDSHKHKKQRQDSQAARKSLLEGTRRGNLGGDTAFGALYDQEQYSDLILSVGNRTFFAHRLVLCAWSDVFKTMLSDPTWQPNNELCDESSDNASGQVIRQELVEEDPDALVFEDFLKFLYTATVALTTENVLSLARLADKYMIPTLHELCCKFVDDTSSDVETMLMLLPTAREFNMPDIVKVCHQSFLTNFNLLSGQQLLDIDTETMLGILDSGPNLVVENEYALFEKIEPWLTQCEDDDILVKIINCIRFPFMTAAQLLKATTTAVFSRASKKLPELHSDVWRLKTLFREGLYKDLPDEFPCPRLYLCQPSSYDSEYLIRGFHGNEMNIVPASLEGSFEITPWITTVAGEKQIFILADEIILDVLLKKVSHDQIKIHVSSSELPSSTQTFHTAMRICLPNQKPKYFKASAFKLSEYRPTTLLKVNTEFSRPIEQYPVLQILVALIIKQ